MSAAERTAAEGRREGPARKRNERARHSWGLRVPFAHKTERDCRNGCGIVKVTRHEGGRHWQEFWRDCECVSSGKTPLCVGAFAPAEIRSAS